MLGCDLGVLSEQLSHFSQHRWKFPDHQVLFSLDEQSHRKVRFSVHTFSEKACREARCTFSSLPGTLQPHVQRPRAQALPSPNAAGLSATCDRPARDPVAALCGDLGPPSPAHVCRGLLLSPSLSFLSSVWGAVTESQSRVGKPEIRALARLWGGSSSCMFLRGN